MKLEHNKKYTPTKGIKVGVVFEYVGFCGKPENKSDESSFSHIFARCDGNGIECIWDCDLHLYEFKEYTPPRPDVELLGDLIERVRYSQTCLPQETLDLLREAEEMKKRMESK